MTPEELDAIRAEHHLADVTKPPYRPEDNPICDGCGRRWPCDRARLVAEVDRLTAEPTYWEGYRAGVVIENARIRAGVEGLARLWANRITSTGWSP